MNATTSPQNLAMDTTVEVQAGLGITETRALKLLGDGIKPEIVAASLGISASRISQLLSDETFAARVAELRYLSVTKHNERDAGYDKLEDEVLERLGETIPLMHRPMELLRAAQILNQAKRRGSSAPEAIIEKQNIVQLTIPIQIINKFQTNLQGQVTSVDEKQLITIQSGALDSLLKEKRNGSSPQIGRTITAEEI